MTAASWAPESPADFGTRFSAFVIDALVLFSGQWILFIVLSRQLQAVGLTSTEPCVEDGVALCEGPNTLLWVILLGVYIATTIGYHATCEGRFGATPGKRMMGLRVANADGHGPIGMRAGLLRSIVRQLFWLTPLVLFDVSPLSLGLPSIVFALIPGLALLVFVLGAFRADARAGHDVVANTMVVRDDSPHRPASKAVTKTEAPPASTAANNPTRTQPSLTAPASDDTVATDDREDSA